MSETRAEDLNVRVLVVHAGQERSERRDPWVCGGFVGAGGGAGEEDCGDGQREGVGGVCGVAGVFRGGISAQAP